MWQIEAADGTINKKLKKFRTDKAIIQGYKRIVGDLAVSDDPRKLGESKHGRYKYCYAIHVSKSHSLVYRVFFAENIVQLIDLDDHKNLFGRDNRT